MFCLYIYMYNCRLQMF